MVTELAPTIKAQRNCLERTRRTQWKSSLLLQNGALLKKILPQKDLKARKRPDHKEGHHQRGRNKRAGRATVAYHHHGTGA